MDADHEREFRDFVALRSRSLLHTAYLLTGDWEQGRDLLQTALVSPKYPSNGWMVEVTFLTADKSAFTQLTTSTADLQLAIVIDDKVVNAPMVPAPIDGGRIDITGYTQQSADAMIDHLTGR